MRRVPPRQPLATGQAAEWLVWTNLMLQTGADLHVFLPTVDRGIDGIVHRLSTDTFTPVQVKGRTTLDGRDIAVTLTAPELDNPDTQVVIVQLDPVAVRLHTQVLVASAATVREAARWIPRERLFSLSVPLAPDHDSPWRDRWVSLDHLGDRVSPPPAAPTAALPAIIDVDERKRHGHRAELAVLTACAVQPALNLFRAAPDYEFIELVAYDVERHRAIGLQVKSVTLTPARRHGRLDIRHQTFRPSAAGYIVSLALEQEGSEMVDECLVIPARDVPGVATATTPDMFEIKWRPHGTRRSRVDPYRLPLADLGARISELLDGP